MFWPWQDHQTSRRKGNISNKLKHRIVSANLKVGIKIDFLNIIVKRNSVLQCISTTCDLNVFIRTFIIILSNSFLIVTLHCTLSLRSLSFDEHEVYYWIVERSFRVNNSCHTSAPAEATFHNTFTEPLPHFSHAFSSPKVDWKQELPNKHSQSTHLLLDMSWHEVRKRRSLT